MDPNDPYRYNIYPAITPFEPSSPVHYSFIPLGDSSQSHMTLPSHFENSPSINPLPQDAISNSIKEKMTNIQIDGINELIEASKDKMHSVKKLLKEEGKKVSCPTVSEQELCGILRKIQKFEKLLNTLEATLTNQYEENCFGDVQLQNEIQIQQMYQQFISNYEYQIYIRNEEIQRLNQIIINLHHFQANQPNLTTYSHQAKVEMETQTDQCLSEEEIVYRERQKYFQQSIEKKNKFAINFEYSVWFFYEESVSSAQSAEEQESEDEQQEEREELISKEPNINEESETKALIEYGSLENLPDRQEKDQEHFKEPPPENKEAEVPIQSFYLRRYKSLVSLSLNALNMCNNMYTTKKRTGCSQHNENRIREICQKFNNEFKNNLLVYDDIFYLTIKTQIGRVYDSVHMQYEDFMGIEST